MISKRFEQRPDFFSVHISRHYGMFFFNLSDVKLGSLVSILPKFDQLFLAFHNLLQFLHIFLFRVAFFHTDLSTQKSAVLLLIRSWIFLRVRCGFECVFWAVLCCATSMFSVLFFFFLGSVGLILCFIPSMALKFVFLIVRHLLPEQYFDV